MAWKKGEWGNREWNWDRGGWNWYADQWQGRNGSGGVYWRSTSGKGEKQTNEEPLVSLADAKRAKLLKDCCNAALQHCWQPFIEDQERASFSYILPRETNGLPEAKLADWFHALHPNTLGEGSGGWTEASFKGQTLLRKTAWYVSPPCQCAYDYADTNQEIVSDSRMRATIEEITQCIAEVCGVQDCPPNSVNLNFYPPGGGVGFHADDEALFDGLRRDTTIISLSLAEQAADDMLGTRWFEVRLKRPWDSEVKGVPLRHGDLMTMEGRFQKFYRHSAWPGDRLDILEAPGRSAFGERVNLTWRWIVCHNQGCPAA